MVREWNVESGALLREFSGHTAAVWGLDFSPDGLQLASAAWDNTVRIWEVSSGAQRMMLERHGDWVYDVAYSPDGTLLASASADGVAIHSERFDLVREVGIIATTHGLDAPSTQGGLWVVADRLRVRQIVRNLITNAKRYGGEHVWLAYGIRSDRVSISVVDDGPGVSAGSEEAVFEPYHSDHSSIGWPGSLGLGLSLSRSMARLMDGNVTYERRDGETWFNLELPAVAGFRNHAADAESARVHDLELERALRQA